MLQQPLEPQSLEPHSAKLPIPRIEELAVELAVPISALPKEPLIEITVPQTMEQRVTRLLIIARDPNQTLNNLQLCEAANFAELIAGRASTWNKVAAQLREESIATAKKAESIEKIAADLALIAIDLFALNIKA